LQSHEDDDYYDDDAHHHHHHHHMRKSCIQVVVKVQTMSSQVILKARVIAQLYTPLFAIKLAVMSTYYMITLIELFRNEYVTSDWFYWKLYLLNCEEAMGKFLC
jgi:hypothetical protein